MAAIKHQVKTTGAVTPELRFDGSGTVQAVLRVNDAYEIRRMESSDMRHTRLSPGASTHVHLSTRYTFLTKLKS